MVSDRLGRPHVALTIKEGEARAREWGFTVWRTGVELYLKQTVAVTERIIVRWHGVDCSAEKAHLDEPRL